MACALISWFIGSILLFTPNLLNLVDGAPQVPCYFIFGDSLADNGNNNNLATEAKANFLPYGIDYPDGPTGRFTNGRNYVDFIAEFLGFENHIPPFATTKGKDILQGVNYASGGSGIHPETGRIVGKRIHLDGQLSNHRTTISRMIELQGNNESYTTEYLGKCIYTVGMGSNDYMNNYLLPKLFPASQKFGPDEWAADLVQRYSRSLKHLHKLGARKVVLYGLGPIGCEPSQIKELKRKGVPGCVNSTNHMVSLYNGRLAPLVDDLNKNLADAKFIYVNSSHISPGNIPSSATGIKVKDEACCKVIAIKGMCAPNMPPCKNRNEYAFWDQYHPTEKSIYPGAMRAYKSIDPMDTYPMDVSHLAQL